MSYYCRSDRVTNGAGDGLSGYKVRALDLTTGLVVAIYSDESGTPLASNQAITDSLGNYSFFIAHGVYSEEYLDLAGNRIGYRRYINMVGDPGAQTASEAAATAAAASQVAAAAAATSASASTTSASASATSASTSATSASLSASIAAAATAMYPDTTTGLAATATNGYFYVPTSGTNNVFATLYQDTGTATAINTVLSGSLITYPNQTDFLGSLAFGGGLTKLQPSTYPSEGRLNTFFGIDAGRDMGQGGPYTANVTFGNTGLGVSVMKLSRKGFDNTGVGYETLINLTDGYNNCAMAPKSLYNTTVGYRNVAIGTTALFTLITGAENTAIGTNSLFYATASGNVALGYGSGWNVTTGTYNVIMGYRAAGGNSGAPTMTADYCVLAGYRAGYALTTALDCTMIGRDAGVSLTTGNSNTVVGGSAMTSNVSGGSNVVIGNSAAVNYTVSNIVAIGVQALNAQATGTLCTAVGYRAGFVATAAGGTFLGYSAGSAVTTGQNNTILGSSAGGTVGGSQNVIVGRSATTAAANNFGVVIGDSASIAADSAVAIGQAASAASSNSIALGKTATTTAANQVMLGNSSIVEVTTAGVFQASNATAIPAGGSTAVGMKATSTANFGIFFGSGAPTLSAAKGSLYLRSDGSGTGDRAYINTNGTTTWTALTTAA